MHFHTLFAAAAVAFNSASAVTVRNHRSSTCKGNYIQCSDLDAWACCRGGPSTSGTVTSTFWRGLPTTGIGALCKRKGSNDCGEVVQSGSGLSICVGGQNGRASMWFDCNYCNKRDLDGGEPLNVTMAQLEGRQEAKTTADADVVGFEDHQFNLDSSVPQADKDQLMSLFEADAGYADIPEELKKYELPADRRRGLDFDEEEIYYYE